MCWSCGALERHRSVWLYLDRNAGMLRPGMTIVHIAPEPMLGGRFRGLPDVRYLSGDLTAEFGPEILDVTALPYGDASIDAVVCNHVLEHVPDDAGAMREIHRVLKPTGWAMLLVPDVLGQDVTLEDPSISDPEERLRRFGQRDHVRRYGWDYVRRLSEAGFDVEVDRPEDALPPDLIRRCRLEKFGQVEPLFVCRPA
jgi:SAM-dependent methyltransferase